MIDISTHKVYVSRHVKFLDNDFPYPALSSLSSLSTSTLPLSSFTIPISLCDPSFSSFLPTVPSPTASYTPSLSLAPTLLPSFADRKSVV